MVPPSTSDRKQMPFFRMYDRNSSNVIWRKQNSNSNIYTSTACDYMCSGCEKNVAKIIMLQTETPTWQRSFRRHDVIGDKNIYVCSYAPDRWCRGQAHGRLFRTWSRRQTVTLRHQPWPKVIREAHICWICKAWTSCTCSSAVQLHGLRIINAQKYLNITFFWKAILNSSSDICSLWSRSASRSACRKRLPACTISWRFIFCARIASHFFRCNLQH